MTQKPYCIIMAGGVGHRLWPLSNARHPKQFTDIFNTGKTCIRQTYERIANIFPPERIFIITRKEFRKITREQIPEIPVENILLEPCNRNTATCIAYAAYKIEGIAPNAVMLIIPSDHFITNDIAYIKDIKEGIEFVARNTGLLTIGIKPTRPETAYGYIQEKNSSGKEKITGVKTFTEKPSPEIAEMFIKSGDFLWNSGIFIWKTQDVIAEFKKHMYDLHLLFTTNSLLNTPGEQEFIDSIYGQCYNVSIDTGIMEKSSNVYVLKGNFGWTDISTWHGLHKLVGNDDNNNVANTENVIFQESQNCTIYVNKDTKVIVQGMSDVIVAEKDNYLMICPHKDETKIPYLYKLWKFKH